MRLMRLPSRVALAVVALLLAGPASMLGSIPPAAAQGESYTAGHVYLLDNDLSGQNTITVFDRASNGALLLVGGTYIGGLGSVTAFADGTQGSLIRTPDGRRLFAVDAGSNQISVVDVHNGQLTPRGVFPSGGAGPVSLTYAAGLLYVLNAANTSPAPANVAGFRVDAAGALHPIAGASKPLSAPHPNPAQVQLDPSGRYLVVTEKGTNRIDVYRVARDGSLSGPTTFPALGAVPFGLAFVPSGHPGEFIDSDALGGPNKTGGAAAYRLLGGAVRAIGGFAPDFQVAPCWMVVTPDGRFAYTSDAYSYTISGYRIRADGTLRLLDAQGLTAGTPRDTFPLEEALSRDGRFLYVLDSRLLLKPPGVSTLNGYAIHQDGHLTTVVDPATLRLPFSAIGLVAD